MEKAEVSRQESKTPLQNNQLENSGLLGDSALQFADLRPEGNKLKVFQAVANNSFNSLQFKIMQQKALGSATNRQHKTKVPINDDKYLENEADVMGAKAAAVGKQVSQRVAVQDQDAGKVGSLPVAQLSSNSVVIQRVLTVSDIRDLFAIDTVSELINWLIMAIASADVGEAIELWLEHNPDMRPRRAEIYNRAKEPMPDESDGDDGEGEDEDEANTLQGIQSIEELEEGDIFEDENTGVEYEYISYHSDNIINIVNLDNNGLYDYNLTTQAIAEQDISGFHEMDELDDDQNTAASAVLRGPEVADQDADAVIAARHGGSQAAIVTALQAYVDETLTDIRASDRPDVDIGSDSSRGKILQRAIQSIMNTYGLEIDYAAAVSDDAETAQGNLWGADLHHSTERWQNAGAGQKASAARLAVVWAMSNVAGVSAAVTATQAERHADSSVGNVINTYATAICADGGNAALLSSMAEIRLRWGPITYGSNIYLEAGPARMTMDAKWDLYKTLIHEALHAAENPNFEIFLQAHIPAGLQSDVREGIVDYLTQKIWSDVLDDVQEAARGTAPDIDPDIPLKATRAKIATMRAWAPAYQGQVQTIRALVAALENGDARLVSAYFGGNVGAFLPKMNG